MKIGILTYHACYNYGACLQAYALQQSILKKEDSCEIIDFQTDSFININHPFAQNPKHYKEFIKNFTRLPYYKSLRKRALLFSNFINHKLKLSKRCSTEYEVKKIAENYDCIVCGSDQTWNLDPSIRYESPVYYLNFPKKQKRITYATSFGSWVNDFHTREAELLPWIKEFNSLSMREESGVDLLQERGLNCEWVLDPTLLLKKEEYDVICEKRIIEEPYVLLFSWNGAQEAIEVAQKVAKELNCKLLYIVPPPRAMFKRLKRKLDVGPSEFLSLIKYAEFVVTNSFHGTVFSTIYEKPFISAIANDVDPRRASLMKQLGLENNLMSPDTLDVKSIMHTNFAEVDKRLEPLRSHSLNYLYNALK